ncbi:transcription termination factor NusA [Brochothrix thermosphacta]|uniref:Transcription termination/antitermination protein NusA n=1 Tax=Brochothrix thermosphacta TaxID=2756 RepID=A0A2X0QFB9_BROTH|nr:transcription termination factor NusA [Brochothrix thermosphacta]ANZ94031.1 transcription termination/antitermination protein NusA [Brochothrix thermosphacta]MDO7863036.1 transcription termination factor NusA [Brochothrix thermosphacta]ODJ47741.1 transcription termination/antitermination protein NusA [Brochothrix thermosphacta]ODJ61742.1 transcription termination/antitermination protein NusA [Brochothrix thermosphacta]ODJ66334.1 transcription termination/antitermination protein NusA [Brocho
MGTELLDALTVLENEKGIDKDFIIEALEAALESAYKRNFDQAQNVRVDINQTTGSMHVFAQKEVVDEILDSRLEITLEQAHEYNSAFNVGDTVEIEVTPRDFGRVAAQTAKQVVTQRVREAERGIIYNEFIDREDDIMTGIVERQDSRFIYVNLGKVEAILSKNEQMPNERYHAHDRIKVYITKVEKTSKGPQIYVSRTHPGLLKRLFEIEVPEIYDGLVEIKSVSREAGDRSKISVFSSDPEIDAVGACVGTKGQRVQAIVDELKGEKIDIVEWSENPVEFVSNALSPAQVVDVTVDKNNQSTTVVVPDYQLSLAIGKRGQNARLAAKLTGWKIDIKNETNAAELGIFPRVEGETVIEEDVAVVEPVEVAEEVAEAEVEAAPTFVVDIDTAEKTAE